MFNSAEPTTDYSRVYQYDPLGYVRGAGDDSDTYWFANIFTASAPEILSAVSFYTASLNASFQIYVYNNVTSGPISGSLSSSMTGTIEIPGYHTIPLVTPVSLTTGQNFSVVTKLTTPGYNYPVPVETPYPNISQVTAQAGQSYVSSDGINWTDETVLHPNTNVCLKAFTAVLNPSEVVSSPATLSGPISGGTGVTYTYSTGGSTSNLGHPTQYRFDWGDGTYSAWSSSTSVSHSWTSAGTYAVKAQARCAIHTSIVSEWSQSLQVTISAVGPDLTGAWTSLTQTCKTTRQGQKCSVKGTFAVSNIGNGDASSTYVKFYLSDNENFDQTDTFLKSFSTGKLKAGKGKNIKPTYNLSTGISASGKYVIAVIDPDNLVDETNESNNVLVYGPIP
jgi:hypothetical protein